MASSPNHDPGALLAKAHEIADQVLFPDSLAIDQAGVVPAAQLQRLADAGFYGISTWCDAATIAKVIEVLAGGSLTATFVWVQHLGAAAAAFNSAGPLRDELADDLVAGRKRGGVAFAQMLRPGTPLTVAEPQQDGTWVFDGVAPWVTGWGHIDVVHAAARHDDDIVWALIDAVESPTLRSDHVSFATMDATQTKVLTYRDHVVASSRITKVEDYAAWKDAYRLGLRMNGSLALGVASRCCRLLNESTFFGELNLVRDRLNQIDPTDTPTLSSARADASLFAVRAATALVAKTGGNAVMLSEHAQRLMREAMFVVVQGQTPMIKAAMLDQLGPD